MAFARKAETAKQFWSWEGMIPHNARGFFPSTPATNLLYGLDVAIDMLNEEGLEHVFARQKGPMGLYIRTIGIARARTKIGLANIVYNMKRVLWLTAQTAPA